MVVLGLYYLGGVVVYAVGWLVDYVIGYVVHHVVGYVVGHVVGYVVCVWLPSHVPLRGKLLCDYCLLRDDASRGAVELICTPGAGLVREEAQRLGRLHPHLLTARLP